MLAGESRGNVDNTPKILFVTPVLGHPPKGGPELRIENSIKALSKISTVSLYCRTSRVQMGGNAAVRYLSRFVKSIRFAPFCQQQMGFLSFFPRAINLFFWILFKRHIIKFPVEGETDYRDVVSTAKSLRIDIIWLGYGNISYPLLKYIKTHSNIPVVVDTDSVWSRYVLRGGAFAKDVIERKRIDVKGKAKVEEERWGTRLADITTAVSEVDAEYYRGLTDDPNKICVFSNVIDLDTYKPIPPPIGFKRNCIFLAGTFWADSPMEDSTRWMLKFVMPVIKKEIPDIHFYIAGKGSDKILSDINIDNVTVVGELPTVLPYLTNAKVAVVPLRFESGTRFKILEAGACGIPVVSTTLGAEGIPTENGIDILIADTPEDFAQAIIRVVCDLQLAENLGFNLKKLVNRSYSIDALADEGRKIIHYVLNKVSEKNCTL